MKYKITLDQDINADSEEEAIEWLKDHIDNRWDVLSEVELVEEEDV